MWKREKMYMDVHTVCVCVCVCVCVRVCPSLSHRTSPGAGDMDTSPRTQPHADQQPDAAQPGSQPQQPQQPEQPEQPPDAAQLQPQQPEGGQGTATHTDTAGSQQQGVSELAAQPPSLSPLPQLSPALDGLLPQAAAAAQVQPLAAELLLMPPQHTLVTPNQRPAAGE